MVRTDETAVSVSLCKIGAELQAEYAAHLVVEFLSAELAGLDPFKIGFCKMITVVNIRGAGGQAVGPSAVLEVEAVGDSLVGIVGASPVADHHSVEAPLALQDIHEHGLVVAEVLILI